MRRWFLMGCALVASLATTSPAGAAFWAEVGDAGNLPATAQTTIGSEPLDGITGQVASAFDPDMYRIFINGGGTFSATTVGRPGTLFDTVLYLFDANGRGVYANDDEVGGRSLRSTLPANNPLTPMAAGIYFLVIAQVNYYPGTSLPFVGAPIFPPFPARSLVGPTDLGGPFPITGYFGNNGSEVGTYSIALTGARFAVPEPSSLTMVAIAATPWLIRARRRRKGNS